MSFRHMLYHLERIRIYPEPEIGEYHHAYDQASFIDFLQKAKFSVLDTKLKFPFSSYVARINHPATVEIAIMLDEKLSDVPLGNEVFYTSQKAGESDGITIEIDRSIGRDEITFELEFLAWLQAAAEKINQVFTQENAEHRARR